MPFCQTMPICQILQPVSFLQHVKFHFINFFLEMFPGYFTSRVSSLIKAFESIFQKIFDGLRLFWRPRVVIMIWNHWMEPNAGYHGFESSYTT